jgi:DNA-directed RNA polymerase subunit K/omega
VQQETSDIQSPAGPAKPAPPIESRFLFVDVAALRAKQLRRGAVPRIPGMDAPAGEAPSDIPHKPERVAMEEVKRGLVEYELSELKGDGS